MRAGLCTVSAPLAACGPLSGGGSLTTTTTTSSPSSDVTSSHQLPAHARFLALHLLLPGPGPQPPTLYFLVQAKARVRDLYHQTCVHFAEQRGMRDTDLFGLALICDGEYLFAEPDSKLSKYAPRSWRTSHSHGLDANGRPALAFYFRVQFYVDSPLLLRDEETRVHYYLQLRLNTAGGAAAEHTTRLAALALQADLGDHHQQQETREQQQGGGSVETPSSRGHRGYRPEDYVPPAMRNPAALRSLEAAHRSLRGLLTPSEARARFIEEACRLQEPVNAHVFRLRASKSEASPGTLLLAVCARGLRVCPDNNPPSTFLWSSIGKLSFERKRFEIRTGHEKLTLYTSCDEKSRLLLALCKAAHQFSMAVAPRLSEARKVEEEERRIRWDGDQRISVISSTSSNTTSGIVSDRVHSEDELEIMITSPPAAPSTESLALAHLLDSTPASSRTSAASGIAGGSSLPVTQLSSGLLGRQVDEDNLDGESGRLTCSESSGKTTSPGNGTGGKCAGSQCSSNCSTVVVTPVAFTKGKGRRPSTSSSLELGYSHTAQNSSVSGELSVVSRTTVNNHQIDNTPQLTEPVYTSGPAPSSHTSGVYTLTSSDQYTTLGSNEQYTTLGSSEQYTTLGSSEQYTTASEEYTTASEQFSEQYTASTSSEILNNQPYSAINNTTLVPTTIDQVDSAIVFRDRSNSNISNCGSFRGDGSDPTDNQQTLLSADELSDLIVGGRYPSCKSVSHTLDSDSDYVTLPPTSYHHGYVPVPPRRVDSALQRPRPPPPPYGAQFVKISDVVSEEEFNELLSELSMREPPPYPTENLIPPPQPVYPSSEESPARFITTRPPNILTAHTSLVGISSPPCYSMPHSAIPPLIPPKVPRSLVSSTMDISSTSSGNLLVPCAAFLPPPPAPARQPPPPPPPPVATVYTSQLPRSQIEQYRQQMYSDVDFVVFPLKEPAISKQEYLEAKQGSIIAALAQSAANQPVFYRSTPYLARYASSQNLSDTYVQLPVYGAPSICSTTGSLEPVIPPPLPPTRPSNRFMRTQSDDNILNSLDSVPRLQLQQPPKFRRLPPPPPPIPTSRTTIKTPSSAVSKQTALDIRTLRETSKKMDLPLIAALCNDRSLIKQTKAFVMPKHPSNVLGVRQTSAAHVKYPVSGLSSTKINSKIRKPASVSHRHPGDKLPELPRSAVNAEDSVVVADSVNGGKMILSTRAKPNNYVFTDHPTRGAKHKTMQSHS